MEQVAVKSNTNVIALKDIAINAIKDQKFLGCRAVKFDHGTIFDFIAKSKINLPFRIGVLNARVANVMPSRFGDKKCEVRLSISEEDVKQIAAIKDALFAKVKTHPAMTDVSEIKDPVFTYSGKDGSTTSYSFFSDFSSNTECLFPKDIVSGELVPKITLSESLRDGAMHKGCKLRFELQSVVVSRDEQSAEIF